MKQREAPKQATERGRRDGAICDWPTRRAGARIEKKRISHAEVPPEDGTVQQTSLQLYVRLADYYVKQFPKDRRVFFDEFGATV